MGKTVTKEEFRHVLTTQDAYSSGLRRAQNRFDDFSNKSQSNLRRIGAVAAPVGVALGAMAAAGAAGFALLAKEGMAFEKSLAEVKTIAGASGASIQELRNSVESLSLTYAQAPVDTAAAMYQTMSAGFTDAADAATVLDSAMQLSIGGITDSKTAVDGLTTVLNSYKLPASEAASVSDAMFVAMKAGKTTIGELSVSLGKATPLAAELGVNIDTLLAATAALTLGGLKTTEAVTGMRAVFAAIVKPTEQAKAKASELGISFDVASVQAMGFQKWLEHVKDKTGGSTEAMGQLFGGVESLIPALALAGAGGEAFNDILEDMKNKEGAASEAFLTMSQTASFQSQMLEATTKTALQTIGFELLPLVGLASKDATNAIQNQIPRMKSWAQDVTVLGIYIRQSFIGFGDNIDFLMGLATQKALVKFTEFLMDYNELVPQFMEVDIQPFAETIKASIDDLQQHKKYTMEDAIKEANSMYAAEEEAAIMSADKKAAIEAEAAAKAKAAAIAAAKAQAEDVAAAMAATKAATPEKGKAEKDTGITFDRDVIREQIDADLELQREKIESEKELKLEYSEWQNELDASIFDNKQAFFDSIAALEKKGVDVNRSAAISMAISNELSKKSMEARAKTESIASGAIANSMIELMNTGESSAAQLGKTIAYELKVEAVGMASKSAVKALFYGAEALGFLAMGMVDKAALAGSASAMHASLAAAYGAGAMMLHTVPAPASPEEAVEEADDWQEKQARDKYNYGGDTGGDYFGSGEKTSHQNVTINISGSFATAEEIEKLTEEKLIPAFAAIEGRS